MTDLVHIGYPKTGTTYLQRHVFPLLDGCAFLHGGPESRQFRPLVHNMYFADDSEYMSRTLSLFLEEWRATHPGDFLLSDENMSGGLFLSAPNWERNAERLHALLPTARILVVVRHQRTMLRSAYTLYIQRGGYATLSDLLAGRAERAKFDVDHLRYDRLVGLYRDLFGADRVEVLPYELLLNDVEQFIKRVVSLIGSGKLTPPAARVQRENRSLSPPSRWILRHTNRMFRISNYNLRPTVTPLEVSARLRPKLERTIDRLVSPALRHRLEEKGDFPAHEWFMRYAESNAALERMTGLDLRVLGYPLPSSDARRV